MIGGYAVHGHAIVSADDRIADAGGEDGGFDKATKGHIRNLDLRLERISAEMASGRDQAVEELRGEIRLLTRTLAAMAEEE